ncbi:hypothetical protein Sjap_006558 [Stephania japonica]|uniref:Uncharacterized protein n=1 Tax=Stephania japonica TaxID=461633 RepID=A0AAP0K8M6_9MAGN
MPRVTLTVLNISVTRTTIRRALRCSANGRRKSETPGLVKIAVTGVTELLRAFSAKNQRLDTICNVPNAEPSISCVDDIVDILQLDYKNAYFLTGNFSSSVYSEDCAFEDPTIKFRGKNLYAQNIKLLVPFFEHPILILKQIEKGADSDAKSILAMWKLRTYLKLPWKPLISIEGRTLYELDDELKIVRHAESWNVSALEAISQIFTPGARKPGNYTLNH